MQRSWGLTHNAPEHGACPRGVLMRTHALEDDVWTVSYMMEKERNVAWKCIRLWRIYREWSLLCINVYVCVRVCV